MTTSGFARLGVPQNLIDALAPQGITSPTPIQEATLPDSLAGRDVLGRGRTGSGKTYAFLLPVVARLVAENRRPAARRPRALILAPTRELAAQIGHSLEPLAQASRLRTAVVFGGVGQKPQVDALERGVDVLIACPGRLLDLMGQGFADLSGVSVTVLDEADHMADMGFLPMVRRILDKTPQRGQRMLFSATLDEGVGKIVKQYLHSPVTHEADPATSPVGTMTHHVLEVSPDDRFDVLKDLASAPGRTIMFTRTKHGAKKLAKKLVSSGVDAVELHGNLSQGARTRNLDAFEHGSATTMVSTDIAARGIHVDHVALVVHADPPVEHKAYLHRSGRTARAGESGTVVTVQTPDQRGDVAGLMRAAKIRPHSHAHVTTTSPVLQELAPGERVVGPVPDRTLAQQTSGGRGGQGRRSSGGRGQGGHGQGARGQGGETRGGQSSRGRGGQSGRSGDGSQQGSGRPARGGRGAERTGSGRSGGGRSGGSGRSRGGSGSTTSYSTSSSGSTGNAVGAGLAAFSSRRGR
ncbi:DEAD/DEAH box helicase [Brachybacterium huguangmaarense]|uniref:DEAD/DEAH box helicase n=1 Tax=Brachybacterium huguangmaarense TaxID=1652028 RepID=A0ABY6G1W8_9MICO|nr:DEAD/DEAH box helicase [Brachybacterium huguangmaarense]UYG17193.1 DEAD/DEAH box helicase [Brachybacterium huguangmaarense]